MEKPKYITKECKRHGLSEYVLEGRNAYRCKKCRQANVAEQRRRNKRKLIAEFGGKCQLCGYNTYEGALHFHHLKPTEKAFGISYKGMTKGFQSLLSEAKKCILLCANCHAEVEAGLHSGVGDR